jgi:hypothetical protein
MPIRIKPVHDLKPCLLDLDSIKGICALVEQNFNRVSFSAEDGVWEVFDEGSNGLVSAVSLRETLDSFTVKAESIVREVMKSGVILEAGEPEKTIEIIFNRREATVKFTGPHDVENWFEHFMIDLKKHLRPPRFRQRLIVDRDVYVPTNLALAGLMVGGLSGGKYCQIILHKRPPNALIENIKANLISNIIWVILVFVTGILFTLLTLWIYRKYGLNINELLTTPSATPSPIPCDGLC